VAFSGAALASRSPVRARRIDQSTLASAPAVTMLLEVAVMAGRPPGRTARAEKTARAPSATIFGRAVSSNWPNENKTKQCCKKKKKKKSQF
jgi:hypothetical protein